MEGRSMPVDPSARKPSEDWLGIVRKNGMPEFAAAFAANPVLHTSVMSAPCVGVECIAAFFETPLPQGLALERNLFLRLCTSEPAFARIRSYEGMKITAPSRSIEEETGSASHD